MIFNNAVAAIIGMINVKRNNIEKNKKLVAISSFGVTTPAVVECKKLLESSGHEVIVFSANGIGGKAMNELVEEKYIDGIIDLTTSEIADEIVGGVLSAGKHRLGSTEKLNLPMVVVPGAIDVVNFGSYSTIPSKYKKRLFFKHTSFVTLMRTTAIENKKIAKYMSNIVNKCCGNVCIIIPKKGYSAYDSEGEVFFDPIADRAFVENLEKNVISRISVIKYDLHINDKLFAKRLVENFLRISGWE